MSSSQLISIMKSPVQVWIFRTGKIGQNPGAWFQSVQGYASNWLQKTDNAPLCVFLLLKPELSECPTEVVNRKLQLDKMKAM